MKSSPVFNSKFSSSSNPLYLVGRKEIKIFEQKGKGMIIKNLTEQVSEQAL